MKSRMSVSLVAVLLLTQLPASAKGWRGIVPLHSSQADVERLIGKPNAKYERYAIDNEVANVFYSSGPCMQGWNVPKDTVIMIQVSFNRTLRLTDLKVDLKKFERSPDPRTPEHVYYNNSAEGIRYVVWEGPGADSGRVLTAYYEPSRDDKRLYCSSGTSGGW